MTGMTDYYIAYSKVLLMLELTHKNNQKLLILRHFEAKKPKNHHFLQKMNIFFGIFFGEHVVLLIFAQRILNSFYSHK